MEAYMQERERLIEADYKSYGLIKLTDQEKIADTKLNIMKQEFLTTYSLDDILDFWTLRETVKSTKLYDVVKRMPKGASLHIHGIASVDGEWVYENLVKEPNVYINPSNYHLKVLKTPVEGYISIEDYIAASEENEYLLKQKLQLNKSTSQGGPTKIWSRFQEMFFVLGNLVNYHTHFKKYMVKSLQEFRNDKLCRVEYRHMLGFVYNDDGCLGIEAETELLKDICDEFARDNPGFSVGFIICGYKAEEPDVIAEKVIKIYELVKMYPGFIMGYDLVGEEENLRQNIDYTAALLEIIKLAREEGNEFPLYLHGGEITMKTLDNVYDVFLLGTKRIGHGISLHRHPYLLSQIIQKQITIESCPLSNYVLGYMKDLRTHPALSYFSHGAKVTISSDDPGLFGYTGVTHDFLWITLLWDLDLAKLKRLVLNSIEACPQVDGLRPDWEKRWEDFIDYLASYSFIDTESQ